MVDVFCEKVDSSLDGIRNNFPLKTHYELANFTP
jgi:hypothetical protein